MLLIASAGEENMSRNRSSTNKSWTWLINFLSCAKHSMRDCSLSLPISSCLSHNAYACCSVCLLPLFSMLINIWHFIEYIIIKKHTTQTISGLNRSTDTARKTPHAHIRWHILNTHSIHTPHTHTHTLHTQLHNFISTFECFQKKFLALRKFHFSSVENAQKKSETHRKRARI